MPDVYDPTCPLIWKVIGLSEPFAYPFAPMPRGHARANGSVAEAALLPSPPEAHVRRWHTFCRDVAVEFIQRVLRLAARLPSALLSLAEVPYATCRYMRIMRFSCRPSWKRCRAADAMRC